jgi:hypothetical protein
MSDFHGWHSFADLGQVTLRRDGQGGCGLLQARIVGFRLDWIRYRDEDVGSGLLDEVEAGHQEVRVALVESDIGFGRSVGGKAKGRAHNVRHGLSLGLPNSFGGVLAAVAFVKEFMRLC